MTDRVPRPNLRRARLRLGWSLERAADEISRRYPHLGIDVRQIVRWEAGETRTPRPMNVLALSTTYGLPPEELDLPAIPGAGSNWDVPHASDTQKAAPAPLSIPGPLAALPGAFDACSAEPWERLGKALQTAHATASLVEDLASTIAGYRRQYASVSSGQLLGSVLYRLQFVTQLLEAPHPDTVRQQLLEVAGETAGLAGWLSFDLRDDVRAEAYYKVGLAATQDLDDPWVHAHILGRMSFLPTYRGNHSEAVGLLRAARDEAARGSSPTVRSWLAAVEAEACACLGDDLDCHRALERAEGYLQEFCDVDPAADIFDAARLAGFDGVCHLRMEKAQAALPKLRAALSMLAPELNRQRANVLADLAAAYVQNGAPEEACQVAEEAVVLARQTRAAVGLQRLRQLRAQLVPWQETRPVRELDAQLLVL
jgi:tetratricopeptide (TPR) repeat protein